jgi:3-hydroxy-9,10-secoandrosta-1,3,5(10)-triene-9,17-dione monooxygenase reductase component
VRSGTASLRVADTAGGAAGSPTADTEPALVRLPLEQVSSVPQVATAGRIDVEDFKAAMGSFATGVAVVTSSDAGHPVGFTCQSIVSLSLEPPLVALAPSKSSTSWPRIARAGNFCVNVLSEGQADLAARFARSGVDKFVGVEWRGEVSGAPVLSGVLSWVDCELELVHDAGDHEIVIGKVLGLGPPPPGARPLIYYRSSYHRLGS